MHIFILLLQLSNGNQFSECERFALRNAVTRFLPVGGAQLTDSDSLNGIMNPDMNLSYAINVAGALT